MLNGYPPEYAIDRHVPKLTSDTSEFHVALMNQNYTSIYAVKDDADDVEEFEKNKPTNIQSYIQIITAQMV